METINNLIKQTKEEIESTRAILQTYLPSDIDIDKMPSSEILEFAMQEDERIRDNFLIQWKDYAFLRGGLIKLQTAQELFIKLLDDFEKAIDNSSDDLKIHLKEDKDVRNFRADVYAELESIKSQLLRE